MRRAFDSRLMGEVTMELILTPSRPFRIGRRLKHAALAAAALSSVLVPTAGLYAQTVSAAGGVPGQIRDTEIEETLHKECDPVFLAAGIDPHRMQLDIYQGEMNAVTFSAREEAVATDLILRTENPNQLIGVMAHETGHAAGGHIERSGEIARAGMAPFLLTLGLGILAAVAGAPGAGAALASSSEYFGELGALRYNREVEARADQAGITYLSKAHISARGLVDFLDAFRYEEVFEEARRFPYFQSHPVSSERIELMRRRAEEQPDYNKVDSPEAVAEYEVMKAKLFGFLNPPQQTFITYSEKDRSFPARYARAIAYYKATETDTALRLIGELIDDYPNNPYLWELKGQVLFESGDAKDAEVAHRKSVELKPGAPLLEINLAQAILAQEDGKRAGEAIVLLRQALGKEPDNAIAWSQMAQAYDAKGDGGDARLAAAEARYAIGDMTQARIFALRARALLKQNTPEWRRATDIVLTSNPTRDDLRAMSDPRGSG
jgi:predicted Zn-dependent protease